LFDLQKLTTFIKRNEISFHYFEEQKKKEAFYYLFLVAHETRQTQFMLAAIQLFTV